MKDQTNNINGGVIESQSVRLMSREQVESLREAMTTHDNRGVSHALRSLLPDDRVEIRSLTRGFRKVRGRNLNYGSCY